MALSRLLFPAGLLVAVALSSLVIVGALPAQRAMAVGPPVFLAVLTMVELAAGRWAPRLRNLPRDLTLFVVGAALTSFGALPAAHAALWLGVEGFGPARSLPPWLSLPLALAIADLVAYGVHRVFHRWKPLWKMHALHHAPSELYALMSVVNGPLMVLLVRSAPVLALVACGFPPSLVAGYTLIDAWIGLCSHTGVDTFNPWLSRVLVTPEVHRLHHSREARHAGNYGLTFTLWDRVFRTFVAPPAAFEPIEPGLDAESSRSMPKSWWRLLFLLGESPANHATRQEPSAR